MKHSLACLWVLPLSFACSTSDPALPPGGSGGISGSTAAAGSPSSAGSGMGVSGANNGGTPSTAGAPSGGSPSGGSASGGASGAGPGPGGSPGSAGSSAGSGNAGGAGMTGPGFKCPLGPFAAPALTGAKATKIPGAPPSDAFNQNGFTNVEGPVWVGDSLYFSELTNANVPPARILKLSASNAVTIVVPNSGSNGLAVDANGNLFAAMHSNGSISQVALPSGTATALVSMFGMPAARFNSPNDLAIRSDGTIYFSDPNFQNTGNPQSAERLYRITPPPTRTVSVAPPSTDTAYVRPNGVTLSPDEHTLYVSGSGIKKYAVMSDGTLGPSSDFGGSATGTSLDGMVVDCAGNLYVTGNNSNAVKVYSAAGAPLGSITTDGGTSTNVAFGGADHKTLYITAQGTEGQRGVFSITLNVPGFPY